MMLRLVTEPIVGAHEIRRITILGGANVTLKICYYMCSPSLFVLETFDFVARRAFEF